MAFGDNGLIRQAELARDLTANSTGYETQATANIVAYMNEMLEGSGTVTPPETELPKVEEVKGGEAFDEKTAIVFIQECGNTNYANLEGQLNMDYENTGVGGDEVCKINDMSSNAMEWITEYSTAYSSISTSPDLEPTIEYTPCTLRGGIASLNIGCAATRSGETTDSNGRNIGFRIILYM